MSARLVPDKSPRQSFTTTYGPPRVRLRVGFTVASVTSLRCQFPTEVHLAGLPAGTAVVETRASDRNGRADGPRPRRHRANHRRQINERVSAGCPGQIAEAVLHHHVQGPRGVRWRVGCRRRVGNGRVRCQFPTEVHLAGLPAGTAVIETRACDRNGRADGPRPRQHRANHRRRINERASAGFRGRIARQSATVTYTAPEPCVGATAVAAPSLTAFPAAIPPKYTWPDCPPVQP